jgi:hypothetical protein
MGWHYSSGRRKQEESFANAGIKARFL